MALDTYGFCGRKATLNHASALIYMSLICQPTSEDMKLYIIISASVKKVSVRLFFLCCKVQVCAFS